MLRFVAWLLDHALDAADRWCGRRWPTEDPLVNDDCGCLDDVWVR